MEKALTECKQWLAWIAGAGEQTFARASYNCIFASEICADKVQALARRGDLSGVMSSLGLMMPSKFHVYWLEGSRVDELELEDASKAVIEKYKYDGFRELILFDDTRGWLIFLDHYDNCKLLRISRV